MRPHQQSQWFVIRAPLSAGDSSVLAQPVLEPFAVTRELWGNPGWD